MKKENNKIDFKVPEGYFESLTSHIMSKVAREDTASQGNDGFIVPEGYMEALSEKVLQRLETEETKVLPIRSYRKHYYVVASIAAILILFIGLLWNRNNPFTYSDLARSDIEEYFDLNGWGFSSYDLAEILPVDQMDLNEILEQQLDNEKVIDYLSTNIKDLEELNLNQDD